MRCMGLECVDLVLDVGNCERGNQPSDFINAEIFFYCLCNVVFSRRILCFLELNNRILRQRVII
jgi:hypothetical protein